MLFKGCTDQNSVTYTNGNGDLLDPNIMPKVVSTYPFGRNNGTINLFASGQEYKSTALRHPIQQGR